MGTPDLVNTVQACDVGLLPYTRKEQSSSGTLPFFLACGRPVICSAFRFAADVLDPSCGLLFPVGDADGLSRALVRMTREPVLRKRMARYAYKKARAWSWDRVAGEYLRVVDAVVAGRRPTASTNAEPR